MKPVIAICGKSASGKDTFAKALSYVLHHKNIDNHMIVSDTTRPPRVNEKDGVSYHFLTEEEFEDKIKKDEMLEYSYFRGWYYGTSTSSLLDDHWNIGVFNADGVHFLMDNDNEEICPIVYIYLYANPFVRLRRSYRREGRWKFEYFRRMFTDWRDFRRFRHLTKAQKYGIIIRNETDDKAENMMKMVNQALSKMMQWGLI